MRFLSSVAGCAGVQDCATCSFGNRKSEKSMAERRCTFRRAIAILWHEGDELLYSFIWSIPRVRCTRLSRLGSCSRIAHRKA